LSEWQPIETAPIGKPLLHIDGPTIEVRWDTHGGKTGKGYFGFGNDGPRWNDTRGRAMSRPTHWRDIEPPSN
jgi:hypothetical protein